MMVPRAGFEPAIIGDVTLTNPFFFLLIELARAQQSFFTIGIF
jgi:hypothetical protein